MGYTGEHLSWKYTKTEQENMVLSRLKQGLNGEVLAHSVVDSVLYAAVKTPTHGTIAAVVPFEMAFQDGGWMLFYKEMSETEGPNEQKCPLKILNLLDATDSEYAQKWREACKQHTNTKNNRIPRKFNCITGKMLIRTNLDQPGDIVQISKDDTGYRVLNTRTQVHAQYNASIFRNAQLFEIQSIV